MPFRVVISISQQQDHIKYIVMIIRGITKMIKIISHRKIIRKDLDRTSWANLYLDKKKSLNQIAIIFNCSLGCVKKDLLKKGIKLRTRSGKDNPNYKQGKPLCMDCNNLLSNYNHKRCFKCYHKSRKKT